MIPIYRAKNIPYGDYVEGDIYEYTSTDMGEIIYLRTRGENAKTHDIDPNTLAIHFPNMIDKNGKKIFASLSEDDVGGDRIKAIGRGFIYDGAILRFEKSYVRVNSDYMHDLEDIEVIGIHKGE